MIEPVRGPFDADRPKQAPWRIPALSVVIGSSITIVPFIATLPILPPLGLMMLFGWRLGRPESLPIWSPLLLGLFDDVVSGQPLGSAMLLWTLSFLAIDLLDQRLVWRDFWQDWLLAAGGIGACLIGGRLVATPLGSNVDTVLLLQTLVSIMLFPVISRLIAWIDRSWMSE